MKLISKDFWLQFMNRINNMDLNINEVTIIALFFDIILLSLKLISGTNFVYILTLIAVIYFIFPIRNDINEISIGGLLLKVINKANNTKNELEDVISKSEYSLISLFKLRISNCCKDAELFNDGLNSAGLSYMIVKISQKPINELKDIIDELDKLKMKKKLLNDLLEARKKLLKKQYDRMYPKVFLALSEQKKLNYEKDFHEIISILENEDVKAEWNYKYINDIKEAIEIYKDIYNMKNIIND